MKKQFVAALVGGIILFAWQFVSWAAVNFHESTQQYTPKQQEIMNFLNEQGLEEGGYIMPSAPSNATQAEWEQMMQNGEGKPWASIQYHKELSTAMGMNMVRGFIINILTVFLLLWILTRMQAITFGRIVTASLFTGLIVFFNAHYTHFIWYETFDIWAHLGDAVISWGLCGVWLGWWMTRNKTELSKHKVEERPYTMAN